MVGSLTIHGKIVQEYLHERWNILFKNFHNYSLEYR